LNSFQAAKDEGYSNKPVRRIVVWILEAGRFEAFCWDRKYGNDAIMMVVFLKMFLTWLVPCIKNFFGRDTKIYDKHLAQFKACMMETDLINDSTSTISDLNCRRLFRMSIKPYRDIS
jgi:hypothetical protein